MSEHAPDGAYDRWLDAIEAGEGYYLACPNGHAVLPPRRVCPYCGSPDVAETPLPDAGEIESHTTVHVPTPAFEDDAPYVTALAGFGPVTITGILRGVDPADVAIGDPVGIEVGDRGTTGARLVVFRPQ